jgi:SAM-dependent methyltransferase
MPSDNRYVLADVEADAELERLHLLEAGCDPGTIRCLETIGVTAGWRCLEVGAGAGSIARWLAQRVGPAGQIVAVDIDPRYLTGLPGNVAVRATDIREDGTLDEREFDLVHCRLLLAHIGDPPAVLARMCAALRVGGFLLAEEPDSGLDYAFGFPGADRYNNLVARVFEKMRGTANADFRRLPELLTTAGLEVIGTDFTTDVLSPGHPMWEMYRLTLPLLTPVLRQVGFTEDDISLLSAPYDYPEARMIQRTMVSSWGRRT